MNIWNGIGNFPGDAGPMVATIGNYDGVHRGHQTILSRVVGDARRQRRRSLLITFDPHPAAVLVPERALKLLQTRRQKLDSLQETGLSDLLILEFDSDLAALTGQEFFDRILEGGVAIAAIHVGENFRFGHRREGDLALLRSIGVAHGFEVHGVATVHVNDEIVCSSAIRRAIESGDVERARRMLGRPFVLAGEVVHGDGRGRTLQCPSANLELDEQMLPRNGVYVTETVALASRIPSVTNVGIRPTVGSGSLSVETHLLDFDEDLYQERVEVRFLARLRDEMRFDSLSELADQLARDRAAAESYFQNQRLGSV